MDWIREKLKKRVDDNALRELTDHSDLIDFASNHYLANSPQDNRSGSRLLTGNSFSKETIEKEIAHFHKAENSLIFSSGYLANLGLISTLSERNTIFIYDELIHASLRDGLRLGLGNSYSFKHNDLEDLAQKLKRHDGQKSRLFLVTESVFSMDGDSPDLKSMFDLADQYEAHAIVDEAHALGVVGENGSGLINQLGLESKVFARIVTFGKAFGLHGAAILGSELLKSYLVNFCRPFIYTTAPDQLFFENIKSAYNQLESDSGNLERLRQNCDYFKTTAEALDLNINGGDAAIFTLISPGNDVIKQLSERLKESGFDVRPILSPTVPKGTERLRICIHAHNTKSDILNLLKTIKAHVAK